MKYQYADDMSTFGFVLNAEYTEKIIEIANFYEKTPYATLVMLIEMTHAMVVSKKDK